MTAILLLLLGPECVFARSPVAFPGAEGYGKYTVGGRGGFWGALDKRIIEEIRNGTAIYGNKGIIDHPNDVRGWPTPAAGTAPEDSDGDGMPDAWEPLYGFDPKDASDNLKDTDEDGYTNIEEFINGTIPIELVGYSKPENNVNTLH